MRQQSLVFFACMFVSFGAYSGESPAINFINREFIVDKYNEGVVEGGKVVSMNVFNRGFADAALIVYDAGGKVVGVPKMVGGAGGETDPISWAVSNPVHLYSGLTDDYKWSDARDSANDYVMRTEVSVFVPEGGRFEVSKIDNWALTYNLLNVAIALYDEVNVLPVGTKISEKRFLSFFEGLLDTDLYSKVLEGRLEWGDAFVLIGVFSETILDPENLDARNSTQKVLKSVASKASGPLTYAGYFGKGLNIFGRLLDISDFKNYDALNVSLSVATDGRSSDPCAGFNYVCGATLGNILSGSIQGANSHFGGANLYAGWSASSEGAVFASYGSDGAVDKANQQTGLQQAAQSSNSVAYKSSDWVVVSGNPATHYSIGDSFGVISAPSGGPVAALNNAGVQETVMQKTVDIPTGVKNVTVGMMANFVTNEYPRYVGSEYNDNAVIEIRTGSGNVYQATLFNKELNSANFQAVDGLPAPLENSGGQTGFERLSKSVPVANGGQLTITVKTRNVGDTDVPSATLINSTSVK
jgi:hypothetical protein